MLPTESSFCIASPLLSRVCVLVTQPCPRLQLTKFLRPWDFPGKNTGVGCHCLLQGVFLTQGSNPGVQHSRQILYPLRYREASILLHQGNSCSEQTLVILLKVVKIKITCYEKDSKPFHNEVRLNKFHHYS